MLEWFKYNWTIQSKTYVVSEILLSQAKWLGFFPDVFSAIYMKCELQISANN